MPSALQGGKKNKNVIPRIICTTFSYVAHGDLPVHRHHKTNYNQFSMTKTAMFNSWERQKQEQLIQLTNSSDRYQTTLTLRLLLLQKMLLRWYRQLKMAPADQETQAAENVAWQAARNSECFSDLLPPPCPFALKKCACVSTHRQCNTLSTFSFHKLLWPAFLNLCAMKSTRKTLTFRQLSPGKDKEVTIFVSRCLQIPNL